MILPTLEYPGLLVKAFRVEVEVERLNKHGHIIRAEHCFRTPDVF
jgi:hypothetical protein